jgi:SNF2 family DNA or RNA helicase
MTIFVSHQTRSLVARFDAAYPGLFPHGTRFTWHGEDLFALPHGVEETKLLHNIGIDVPPPIIEHYGFPSADGRKAFAKQVLTAASMVMHERSYVLNQFGTGKTRAAIWAFDFLQQEGLARRMLVVAPLSTLNFTWAREIFNTLPHKVVRVLTGDAARRKRLLAEKADIYVVNHDGVKVLFKELMQRLDIDVICFDEVAAYRNSRAERSKIAQKLSLNRRYIWGMTGSPTPSAPTDAFGLARLITPATAPRSFTHFRQDTMINVSQFKWVARSDAKDTVAQLLQPSVRFSLDEIIELPPVIEREIEVPIGPRQRQVYDVLKEHASALLKEGTVTAANGGVLFSKLLQASIGWVYGDDDRKVFTLDNQARLESLLDIIESAERKVIVFSPFKSATAGIGELLKREKIDFATVTGDTAHGERTRIFSAFQGSDQYRVLNAHPECMSHGLTLTAADTVVWFGPVTKLETYEQANARITRVGQVHKQQIIRLVGTPVERTLYRRLADKQQLQDNILDLLAEITGGSNGQA